MGATTTASRRRGRRRRPGHRRRRRRRRRRRPPSRDPPRERTTHDLGPMGELFPPMDPQQQSPLAGPPAARPSAVAVPQPAAPNWPPRRRGWRRHVAVAAAAARPPATPASCATAGGEHGPTRAWDSEWRRPHRAESAARRTWLRFARWGSLWWHASRSACRLAFGDALHAEMARHADLIFVNATAVADGSAMQAAFGWWLAAPARFASDVHREDR